MTALTLSLQITSCFHQLVDMLCRGTGRIDRKTLLSLSLLDSLTASSDLSSLTLLLYSMSVLLLVIFFFLALLIAQQIAPKVTLTLRAVITMVLKVEPAVIIHE